MKSIWIFLLLFGAVAYGDDSFKQEQIEMQLENLAAVDQQIEGLVRQRAMLKAEAAEAMERGTVGVLPREGRRADRRAEEVMDQLQQLTGQIQELESRREQILLSLS